MLAPRGVNYLVLYDSECQWLGTIPLGTTHPLWCEGSYVFLAGGMTDGETAGNVWNFEDGYEDCHVKHVPAYGSTGGIEDIAGPTRDEP
jgi:hypothetical protein